MMIRIVTFEFVLAVLLSSLAHADVQLQNLAQPVPMVCQDAISLTDSQPDEKLMLITSEPIIYQKKRTQFKLKGHIKDVHSAKRFGRNGYVAIEVDEVCQDKHVGEICQPSSVFTARPVIIKLYNPEVQQAKNESTPLKTVRDIGLFGIDFVVPGLGTAAMAGIGIKDELNHDHSDKSAFKKVATGAWKSTGVPQMIQWTKVSKNPDYKLGDRVHLKLPTVFLDSIINQF